MKINKVMQLISLVLVMTFSLAVAACSKGVEKKSPAPRTVIDEARFIQVLNDNGIEEMSVIDTRPEDFVGLQQWYVGTDEPIRIHLLIYDNDDNAQAYLDNLKSINGKRSNTESELTLGENFEYYAITIGESYNVVSRIENTLIHVMATSDAQERMDKIVVELGY